MNTKNFQVFTQILEYVIKYFKLVVLFAVILIVLSGIYRVESNEVAVVLRFGRIVGNAPEEQIREAGLHFALPFFVDEVIRVPTLTVHEVHVTTHYSGGGFVTSDLNTSGFLLTGDNNIALISATVRYQIDDAVQYALFTDSAVRTIDGVVSGELTRAVSGMNIDHVLTGGRAELGATVMRNSQAALSQLQTGVMIISLDLIDVIPPVVALEHFEGVRNAAVIKETNIQQAREQATNITMTAEAEASSYRQAAVTNQTVRLTRVHNVMAEFNGVYDQFVQNPDLIMYGAFRQRVGAIFAQSGGAIIIPDGEQAPTFVLPSGR